MKLFKLLFLFVEDFVMAKCYSKDVINTSKNEVGYLEKRSNSNLDNKTANAGSANYTKYARDYAVFAGVNLQAQSWCDMFIDWCFVQAFGKEKAKELLGGFNAYTPSSAQYFINMKKWNTSNPKSGDIIFFKNTERICHTGIVTKVSSSMVYTIEGNTSSGSEVIANGGGVFEKQYYLTNPRIAGYGRPNYDEEINVANATDKTFDNVEWVKKLQATIGAKVDGKPGNETLSKTPTIKRGTVNVEVIKLIQEKLKALGYVDFTPNGKYGLNPYHDMWDAVNKFQKEYVGLKNPDGEFTAKGASWKALLGIK
jgi:hypothetical protein